MSNVIKFLNKDCMHIIVCPECNCSEFIVSEEYQLICAECMYGYEDAIIYQREHGRDSNGSIH